MRFPFSVLRYAQQAVLSVSKFSLCVSTSYHICGCLLGNAHNIDTKRGTQVETRKMRLAPSAYQISAAATRADVAAVLACNCHGDVVDGGLDGMPSSLLLTPSRVEQVGAASVRSWDGTSQQAFPLTARVKLYVRVSAVARGNLRMFSKTSCAILAHHVRTTRFARYPAPSRGLPPR